MLVPELLQNMTKFYHRNCSLTIIIMIKTAREDGTFDLFGAITAASNLLEQYVRTRRCILMMLHSHDGMVLGN